MLIFFAMPTIQDHVIQYFRTFGGNYKKTRLPNCSFFFFAVFFRKRSTCFQILNRFCRYHRSYYPTHLFFISARNIEPKCLGFIREKFFIIYKEKAKFEDRQSNQERLTWINEGGKKRKKKRISSPSRLVGVRVELFAEEATILYMYIISLKRLVISQHFSLG